MCFFGPIHSFVSISLWQHMLLSGQNQVKYKVFSVFSKFFILRWFSKSSKAPLKVKNFEKLKPYICLDYHLVYLTHAAVILPPCPIKQQFPAKKSNGSFPFIIFVIFLYFSVRGLLFRKRQQQ